MEAWKFWLSGAACVALTQTTLATPLFAQSGEPNWSFQATSVQEIPPAPTEDAPAATAAPAPIASTAACGKPACAKPECDCPTCKAKKAPPPSPFKPLAYDNDWKYLEKPGTKRDDYFEHGKRLKPTCDLTIDLGGQYRHQFKNEDRRSLLTGVNSNPRADSFSLNRVRLYSNVEYDGWLRGFVEYIDASSFHEDLPPLAIDVNRSDVLNAFGEALLIDGDEFSLKGRVGRQELLYNEQRLVSPLDWANTRRTFDGAKLMAQQGDWKLDGFWVRPVLVDDVRFDQADQSQSFFGGVLTGNLGKSNLSFYFYGLEETAGIPANRPGGPAVGASVLTYGVNLKGGENDWLWDIEGAMQGGSYGDNAISAGMFTAGIGRSFPKAPWKPVVWGFYDYASGDEDPTDGTVETFNQLFPLGHKWMGFLDLVARQNIHDVNFQLFVSPNDKLTLMAWQHFFWLDEAQDALYNVTGAASRRDPTGASGTSVGSEIDLTATYKIRPGMQFTLGYAHFFSGSFITNTGGQDDAYLVYTDFQIDF